MGGFHRVGPGYWGGPHGGGAGLLGLLLLVLVVAGVIWLVASLLHRARPQHQHFAGAAGPTPVPATEDHETSEALRILNERFARGEIDVAEFTQRRDLLRGN